MLTKNSVSDQKAFAHPVSLSICGHYYQAANSQPEFSIVPRRLERVEILTGGRGWMEMDGKMVEVTAGALVWHVEGDLTISRSDPDDPYRCVNIHMEISRRETRRRAPRLCWWRDMGEIDAFANEAIRCHVDDSFDRSAVLAYVYGRLIFQVRLSERLGLHENLPAPIRHALDIIESRFAEPLPLKQIAGAAGWSVAHFHEVFQRQMNASPHQVLLQRRIRRARELLSSTDLSVKQVSSECGFSTAASFGHAFKNRVGITPRTFRQQATGRHITPKIEP